VFVFVFVCVSWQLAISFYLSISLAVVSQERGGIAGNMHAGLSRVGKMFLDGNPPGDDAPLDDHTHVGQQQQQQQQRAKTPTPSATYGAAGM
jgi:hypothetical protein